MKNYVDVTPLQEPLPEGATVFEFPGTKPLAMSKTDYAMVEKLLGINMVDRVVELSDAGWGMIRIKVIAS